MNHPEEVTVDVAGRAPPSLAMLPAGGRERRVALAVVVLSCLIFAAAAPFARQPLSPVPAFLPVYQSALVMCDLITAVLMFGQYRIQQSRALLVLASAYLLVVAILWVAARPPRRWVLGLGLVAYIGLLWTHTRAALIALTIGLFVIALIRRRWEPAALSVASLVVSVVVLAAFPTIGPSTSYTPEEIQCLREQAQQSGGDDGDALAGDSSSDSHFRNLRDGLRTVLEHPLGFGLGNAGVNAARTTGNIKAGESTYTELGVDIGLLGMLVFAGWLGTLTYGLWRRSEWLAATLVAIAVIGIQTDVIGVPWIAVVVFSLAGAALNWRGERSDEP